MTRTDEEGRRGRGLLRELAPIAAAAGAAALTVTLVVGPTTARLRSSSGEASEAAVAVEDAGRLSVPGGDVQVRVRPRQSAPSTTLTDVFDLVRGPESRSTPAPTPVFVVSARPQPNSTVRIGVPAVPSAVEIPAPEVLSSVVTPVAPVAPVAPPAPGVTSADAPAKRPAKPLRPSKDPATPVSAPWNPRALDNAEAKTERAEARAADKADAPANDKKADKSKK